MKRLIGLVILVPVCLATMGGCPKVKNQASHSSIPDGITQFTDGDLGWWDAPGGYACRWWISDQSGTSQGGTIYDNGNTEKNKRTGKRVQKKGLQADQSQTILIGTGDVGGYLHSSQCAPNGWKPRP